MSRKRSAERLSRAQLLIPSAAKRWLEEEARTRDQLSKAAHGPAVRISHMVTWAVEFYREHPDIVDAWLRDQETPIEEVRDALMFFRGNRRLGRAFLKEKKTRGKASREA